MSSLLDVAVRRAGNGGFDRPIAALAAGAAAAMLLLMPVDLLQDLVIESGLPNFFPPAVPPLGLKARVGFAVAAALIAFAMAYGVMRMIGRSPRQTASRLDRDEVGPASVDQAPRMRRRDLHPDAPVRAPLSALRDLGDPLGEARAPLFKPEPEPEPQIDAQPKAGEADDALVLTQPGLRQEPELLQEEPELRQMPELLQEEYELRDKPKVLHEEPDLREEPEPREKPASPPGQPEPRPTGDATIAELMARLERALERRDVAERPADSHGAASANEAVEPMDARLRSALENLKRFAPSHG